MKFETPEIRRSIQRMICTGCGAEANAACNCGVAYQPKSVRAREAVEANPEKSNRAIAAEIGADEKTVRKAREATADLSAVQERTGLDGKTRKMPEKKPEAEPETDAEPEHYEFTEVDYNDLAKAYEKLHRAHQKLVNKQPLAKGDDDDAYTLSDYIDLTGRNRKLEARNAELSAALSAKEAQAARDWPADMTSKQIKQRDKCLRAIAAWQRDLEQLYGEVTGQPSWRVELIGKNGVRIGNGARLGTRGEADHYKFLCLKELEAQDGAGVTGEVIACTEEKANVEIEGDAVRFAHGDCVLLNWRPVPGQP